jgi:hypothetical protein
VHSDGTRIVVAQAAALDPAPANRVRLVEEFLAQPGPEPVSQPGGAPRGVWPCPHCGAPYYSPAGRDMHVEDGGCRLAGEDWDELED